VRVSLGIVSPEGIGMKMPFSHSTGTGLAGYHGDQKATRELFVELQLSHQEIF
jgi:hypothetical protein